MRPASAGLSVNAQTALAECRLARQKPLDISDAAREQFVEQLKTLIAEEPDDRASACLDALTTKNWGLDAVEKIVTTGAVPAATQDVAELIGKLKHEGIKALVIDLRRNGGGLLSEVQDRGTLRCGVNEGVPGFGLVDEAGAYTGFAI